MSFFFGSSCLSWIGFSKVDFDGAVTDCAVLQPNLLPTSPKAVRFVKVCRGLDTFLDAIIGFSFLESPTLKAI